MPGYAYMNDAYTEYWVLAIEYLEADDDGSPTQVEVDCIDLCDIWVNGLSGVVVVVEKHHVYWSCLILMSGR